MECPLCRHNGHSGATRNGKMLRCSERLRSRHCGRGSSRRARDRDWCYDRASIQQNGETPMSRNLTVLLSVVVLTIGLNLPTAFSTVPTELSKSEVKRVKKIAKNKAKRQVRKKHPVDTDGLVDGAVTITKLDSSIQPGGTLPRDARLVGIFGTRAGSSGNAGTWSARTGVFFGGHVLPVRPMPHVILPDDTPTASCPGSAAAPDAASGHLCLYLTSFNENIEIHALRAWSEFNGFAR